MPAMFDAWNNLLLGCLVTPKLVGNQDTWYILAALKQLAEELLGGGLIPSALHQDIEHVAILVNRPPQIVGLAVDFQKHFVEEPLVSRAGTPPPQMSENCPNRNTTVIRFRTSPPHHVQRATLQHHGSSRKSGNRARSHN